MVLQRRLRVVRWLSTTPAVGVCTLCSREFKVPMSALRRTADAQVPADVLLRQDPDEEEDEEQDDHKEEDGDGDEDDGHAE